MIPFQSENAFSGAIVSSVLVYFFWACNAFMKDPSTSSPVKKEETAFDNKR